MAPPNSFVRFGLCGHTTPSDASILDGRNGADCPVCGRHHAFLSGPFVTQNHVPNENRWWDIAARVEATNLKLHRCKPDEITTVEEHVARVLSGHVAHWDLLGDILHSSRTTGPPANTATLVWRAYTCGSYVKQGVVCLPVGSVLLLEGRGAHFQDITFSGGVIVCAGPNWTGSFRGCTFRRSGVCAAHGAAVTLRDCAWHECSPALVASGTATAVTCATSKFDDCFSAVVADRGAALTLRGCKVRNTTAAVIANDAGTRATVRGCTLRGIETQALWSCGVSVHGGAAEVRNCAVSHFQAAMFARGTGSRVQMRGGQIHTCESGLQMVGSALGTLRNVELVATLSAFPVRTYACGVLLGEEEDTAGEAGAGGRGGRPALQLERCTTHGPAERMAGVRVGSGGRAALDRCRLRSGGAVAVAVASASSRALLRRCLLEGVQVCCTLADPGSMLRLQGCVAGEGAMAAAIAEGGTLELVDMNMRQQREDSGVGMVTVLPGTTLRMLRCELRRGEIAVQASRSDVRLTECRIADMQAGSGDDRRTAGAGVKVTGGSISMRGGTLERCLTGVAVCDSGEGEEVTAVFLEGVACTNCLNAVEVTDSAEVDVVGCEFGGRGRQESRAGAGAGVVTHPTCAVFVNRAIRVSVSGAKVTGLARGVMAVKCTEARVRDSSFWSMAEGGTCIFMGAEAVVSGCEFRGARHCVTAHAGCAVEDCTFASSNHGVMALAACAVRRCKFGPGVDHGVAAEHGGRARVDGCEFTACHIAMHSAIDSEVVAHDCVCTNTFHCMYACDVGGSLSGTRIRSTGGTRAVVAGCATSTTIPVTLTDCTFGAGLVFLQQGVRAEVVRCTVSNTQTGIQVSGAASARAESCKISGCEYGITVGNTEDALERGPCSVCSVRSASPADWKRAMWKGQHARQRAGTLLQPGARCPHDGAIAQLAIEDTEIRDCSMIGLGMARNGHCDAARVRVVRCTAGVQEVFLFVRSVYRGCVVAPRPGARHRERAVRVVRQQGPRHGFSLEVLPEPDGITVEQSGFA